MKRVYGPSDADQDIFNLGIDAGDARSGIASLVKQFQQYNRGIDDVASATIKYNAAGRATGVTIKSINKEGQALSRTFKETKKGIQLVTTSLKAQETAFQRAKRASRSASASQSVAQKAQARRLRRLRKLERGIAREQLRERRIASRARKKRLRESKTYQRALEKEAKASQRAAAAEKRRRAAGRSRLVTSLSSAVGRGASLGGLGTLGSSFGTLVGSGAGIGGGLAATGGLTALTAGVATLAAGFLAAAAGAATFFGAIAAGLPESIKFGRQIAELRTISQESQLSFTAWATGVEAVSNKFALARGEIAEGAYQTLSNQVAQGAEAFKFLNQAAKLSILQPTTSVTDAVNAISSVINSYSLEVTEAERISAVWFRTMEQGRLRLNEVSNRVGRLTFSAANLGISFEESAAGLALLTRSGLPAGESMTLIINVINQLIKSSPALRDVYRQWGVDNANQAVSAFGLGGILQRLSKSIVGNSDALSKLFPELRAFRGVAGLASDGAARYGEILDKVTDSQDFFNNALKDTSKSPAFQAQKTINELKNTMSDLSDVTLQAGVMMGTFIGQMTGASLKGFKNDLTTIKSVLEAIALVQNTGAGVGIAPTAPSQVAKSIEASKQSFAARGKALAQFAATVKSKFNAINDLEKERRTQLKEHFKSQFQVRIGALKKLTSTLDRQAAALRKSVRDSKTLIRDLNNLRQDAFKGAQRTDLLIRRPLTKVLGPEKARAILGGQDDIAIQRLRQLKAEAASAAQSGDKAGLRTATGSQVGILQGFQQRLAGDLNKFTKEDLKNPRLAQEFVSRVKAIRGIQQQINQLKQQELTQELQIEAVNKRKAAALQKKAEANKILIKDINAAQKRLLKLDPSKFKSREAASRAFEGIAGDIERKSANVDGVEGVKIAQLVSEIRADFNKQLNEKLAIEELNSNLINLSQALKELNKSVTDGGAQLAFQDAEARAGRSIGALVPLKQGLQETFQEAKGEFDATKQAEAKKLISQEAVRNAFTAGPSALGAGLSGNAGAIGVDAGRVSDFSGIPGRIAVKTALLLKDLQDRSTAGIGVGLAGDRAAKSSGPFSFNPTIEVLNRQSTVAPQGNTSNFGNINVTVEGTRTPEGTARNIGRALRREMRRGTTRLPGGN